MSVEGDKILRDELGQLILREDSTGRLPSGSPDCPGKHKKGRRFLAVQLALEQEFVAGGRFDDLGQAAGQWELGSSQFV